MGLTETILAVAALTYATRAAGFVLARRRGVLPPALDRFLGYVPVAVFAALVALGLGVGTPEAGPRTLAVAVAAVVAFARAPLWATLAAGMAVVWLLRLA